MTISVLSGQVSVKVDHRTAPIDRVCAPTRSYEKYGKSWIKFRKKGKKAIDRVCALCAYRTYGGYRRSSNVWWESHRRPHFFRGIRTANSAANSDSTFIFRVLLSQTSTLGTNGQVQCPLPAVCEERQGGSNKSEFTSDRVDLGSRS